MVEWFRDGCGVVFSIYGAVHSGNEIVFSGYGVVYGDL